MRGHVEWDMSWTSAGLAARGVEVDVGALAVAAQLDDLVGAVLGEERGEVDAELVEVGEVAILLVVAGPLVGEGALLVEAPLGPLEVAAGAVGLELGGPPRLLQRQGVGLLGGAVGPLALAADQLALELEVLELL